MTPVGGEMVKLQPLNNKNISKNKKSNQKINTQKNDVQILIEAMKTKEDRIKNLIKFKKLKEVKEMPEEEVQSKLNQVFT